MTTHTRTPFVSNPALFISAIRSRGKILKPILKTDNTWRSNDSEIYDRWAQAIASAYDLVREAASKPTTLSTVQYGAVFPWLVIPDEALWRANYDASGALVDDPEPVDRCRFYIAHSIQLEPKHEHQPICLSHIEFATLKGFREFLRSHNPPDWDKWIPPEVRKRYRGG
jgi:hypothetical protein